MFGYNINTSLLVGLASNAQVYVLITALSFHQAFEGIALGARLYDAGFRPIIDATFALIFALAAPAGIAAGVMMLQTQSINVYGEVFLMTQGTLDACTSGLLLHVAASKLIVEFPRDCMSVENDWKKLFGLYLAVSLGAGFMAFIGEYL